MRLLAAVSLVALLALTGCVPQPHADRDRDDEATELEAPDSFADFTTTLAWAKDKDKELGGTRAQDNETLFRADRDVSEELLSESYGAEAVIEAYQRDDFREQVQLRMVAAQADGYFVPAVVSDFEHQGLNLRAREVRTIGDVECLVTHIPSTEEESDENTYSECMMRSESLTIWLGTVAMVPDDLAELVDEVWDDVDGGDPIAPSTSSTGTIDLPASFEGFAPRAEVYADDADRLAGYVDDDLAALAAAYGVDAGAASYASPDLRSSFDLYLVDKPIVEPFVPYQDPERLGLLAANPERVEIDGAVCQVTNNTVPAGGDVSDLEPKIQWCYLTDGDRTVFALNVAGDVADDTALIPAILHSVL